MIKRTLIFIALGLLIYSMFPLMLNFSFRETLPEVSRHYVQEGPEELGSANVVTSVVATYRGFDTLGEVVVLFAATAGVGVLLKRETTQKKKNIRQASLILETGAALLFPLIILFGVYIFMHGHLTPGGGFQGGVVIASAFLLLILSNPESSFNHNLMAIVESLSGLIFVGIAGAGLVLAGGFLDNRILPLGEFGSLFSAGSIPLIYSFLGLKVGAELTGILDHLKEAEE